MKVALFIPCYVDQFYPKVGIATLELLEKLGCDVFFPRDQTCCGQPLANSGHEKEAIPVYQHFIKTFSSCDYVVAPSASCVYHVKHHYNIIDQSTELQKLQSLIFDLTEFLVDVLKVVELEAHFPHKVGLHQSCHGLRGERLASGSELLIPAFSKWKYLLNMVQGLELTTLEKEDECCGFGGTFSIKEERVSVKMGQDRVFDHAQSGAEFITSGDMSCLMHLEGIIKRNHQGLRVIHMAEILNNSNL